MRYLLDTNIFLWWLDNDKQLNRKVLSLIKDPKNHIFISVANGWEISIKHRAGKLPLKTTLRECFEKSEFELLPINLSHIFQLDKLPRYHKDPFDRMLIAQAKEQNLTLITNDKKIWKYKVDILKA